jgi:ACT domain-containing protein
MKRVIRRHDIEAGARGGEFRVEPDMIVSPLAVDYAAAQGVRLVYPERGGARGRRDDEVPAAVDPGATFDLDDRLLSEVAERVAAELARRVPQGSGAAHVAASGGAAAVPAQLPAGPSPGTPRASGGRAVITATGRNRPGIVAALTSALAELGVDIVDISQTLVADYFTMIIVADVRAVGGGGDSFRAVKERIEGAAASVGCGVLVMHEDLLAAMHRI